MAKAIKITKLVRRVVVLAILAASFAVVTSDCVFNEAWMARTSPPEMRQEKMSRYRLPNYTIPTFYDISIEPNMDQEILSWRGKVDIEVRVTTPTRRITLHAYRNLLIDESYTCLARARDGTVLKPNRHLRDDQVEFLWLQFDSEIYPGNYSLRLKFEGSDSGDYIGFYKSSSRTWNEDDNLPNVAGTHFEATTARRAFPCWDEPGIKARFQLSIKHYQNYTVVSNMPETRHVETADGKILTSFHATPLIPTYLLTFVIADYEGVFDHDRNLSLHAAKADLGELKYIMNISHKVVEIMKAYTGLPFGVPKIGSVVLDRYTAAATEHWGLVTYSVSAVRFNASLDMTSQKDRADMLIAHELAHSWFGNRVTPVWWDDLWLNEAFATYFQYYIADKIYDNRKYLELFVLRNNQEVAFPVDDDSAIPIRWTPITNTEIRRLFGLITYRKGSAVVHMFRNVLGDDAFQAGIRKFLTKHSFESVVTDNLLTAFQEAYDENYTGKIPLDLKEKINSWLVQKGYPIINITRNYTTGETVVSQKSTLINDVDNATWWIPLSYTTESSLNFSTTLPAIWLNGEGDYARIAGIDKNDWIIFNIRANGYYRVNYDEENWKRLALYLNTDNYKNIHVLNRVELISDAFFLAEREPDRYYKIFYNITKYLSREVEYLPWRAAHFAIKRIDVSLQPTQVHRTFQRYFLELMRNFIEKVGFEVREEDDHFAKLARTDVIEWACISGHSECAEYSATKLLRMMKDPRENTFHPDTGRWIYCAGLKGLNNTALKEFVEWANVKHKSRLMMNVACTENHQFHRSIFNISSDGNITETSYETSMLFKRLLMSSDENFNYVLDFFIENHRAIDDSYGSNGWNYFETEFFSDIVAEVKSTSRLNKLREVATSYAAHSTKNISQVINLRLAEENVIVGNANADRFLRSWDKHLSFDNSISATQIHSR